LSRSRGEKLVAKMNPRLEKKPARQIEKGEDEEETPAFEGDPQGRRSQEGSDVEEGQKEKERGDKKGPRTTRAPLKRCGEDQRERGMFILQTKKTGKER